ncbi:nuclear autoantigenic sperm protein-like [Impatiens glandulifera]|uniref:nuclear autoantigenic sperm protein-like n=1 Tax=Impatiens glandulifera TaxID=253017 RepID=UPI001FB13BD8|nr:nuclear autoantigenic sperm protein-like [Impatiens glandulifera]
MVAPEKEEESEAPSGKSTSSIHGGVELSSLGNLAETSIVRNDGDYENMLEDEGENDMLADHSNSLDYATVLIEKGSTALDAKDYMKTAECYSRALEIQLMVAHFGDLAPECFRAYYYYGYALLCRAIRGDLYPVHNVDVENDASSDAEDNTTDNDLKKEENDEMEIDTDDTPNNGELETELDLAWKLLDIARVIVEKRGTQSMDNVNVLWALAEANFYRELATSYHEKALKCCCSKLSLLEKELRRLSESGEEAVGDSTNPHQSDNSSLIRKAEEEIVSVRDYSIMLESKLKELKEPMANLRGAVDALSAKVRPVDDSGSTGSSTSSFIKVRELGKFGGSVNKVSVSAYLIESEEEDIDSGE